MNFDKTNTTEAYIPLTQQDVESIKDGDELYYTSSWGMQKCIYPNTGKIETHSLLFGNGEKDTLTSYFKKNPYYNEDDMIEWFERKYFERKAKERLNQAMNLS